MQIPQQPQPQSLHTVPQSILLQTLSQYFLSPSPKPLPYYSYFTSHPQWQINALTYLFNFVRASHHGKVLWEVFANMLPLIKVRRDIQGDRHTERHKVEEILGGILGVGVAEGGPVSKKVLLARYISLPSAMGQYLASNELNALQAQSIIVSRVCKYLSKLDLEQKIFIINKIITLGHSSILIEDTDCQQIMQVYEQIVKKQSLLSAYFQQVLNNPNPTNNHSRTLKSLLQKFHQTNSTPILQLLHQPLFVPHQAPTLYSLLHNYPSLQSSVFQDLLVWWVQGNDHYLVYNFVKFKANLMAQIMIGLRQQELITYTVEIGLGIQRRLGVMGMGATAREVVELIWGILGERMGMKMDFKWKMLKTTQTVDSIPQPEAVEETESIQQNQKQPKQDNVQEKEQKGSQFQPQILQLLPKPPKNLYDCILGLRNPLRKPITLKLLPSLIRQNPDDLIFVWKDLILQLTYNLQDTQEGMIGLFVTKPQQFIDHIAEIFFKKDHSLNDKILIMNILGKGVEELAQQPRPVERDLGDEQFYFKKVSSRYYKQDEKEKNETTQQMQDKKQSRTRRWGHTRIAYQNRLQLGKQSSTVGLKIIDNEPYINRLYDVANKLFFKIISRLAMLSIFPSEPMFTRPMLQLLATLSSNLKNHIQKYRILTEIVQICHQVIEYISKPIANSNSNSKSSPQSKAQHTKKWKDTNLAILNTLNKISLVIDRYVPDHMLQLLEKSIVKLKASPEYGINPIINMIQANIYTNVSGEKTWY